MAKAAISRLLLMRSGRTEWDLLGRVQGATDLPIAPAALDTVQCQVNGLTSSGLDVVLTAPDEASRETGRLLGLASQARKVAVVRDLGEMALGLWEGLRQDELEERYCRAGRQFLENPCGIMAPEGDSVEAYATRVFGTLLRALARQRKGATVGVVVRPMALGLIRCALNGVDMGEMWSMLNDRPDVEWYQITRNDPRLAAGPQRPRPSAKAA